MRTEQPGPEDDRQQPAAPTDDERPAYDEDEGGDLPDHLDLPLETPEADAIEQAWVEPLEDDAHQ